MPQQRRVAFMTVQTDESSAAADTCSVTDCCHAVLMAGCSILWAHEGKAALAHPRLHSWQVNTTHRPVYADRSRGRTDNYSRWPGLVK